MATMSDGPNVKVSTSDLCFGCRAIERRPLVVSDYMAYILEVPKGMVAEQFSCAGCGVTDVRIVKERS
jgi:hypothetical protein